VIFSQVRLQTFSPEVGDATARATVRASVLMVRLVAAVTDAGIIIISLFTKKVQRNKKNYNQMLLLHSGKQLQLHGK